MLEFGGVLREFGQVMLELGGVMREFDLVMLEFAIVLLTSGPSTHSIFRNSSDNPCMNLHLCCRQ